MKIIFERSGGFMGLKSNLNIDLKDLSADQAEMLRGLLDNANFFTQPESPPNRSAADGFQYVITVETELVTHTIHTNDTAASEELRPLLQELSQRIRSRRRQ
jgi:hypothetical protein